MRLTKQLREAFVRAVMADVPNVDYREKAIKVMMDAAVRALPEELRTLWQQEKLRPYFKNDWLQYSGWHGNNFPTNGTDTCDEVFTEKDRVQLDALRDLYREQTSQRNRLETKLMGVAISVQTTKRLAEALPEFAKYLPAEVETSSNLPALANIVTDFVKAGWPAKTS